VRISSSGGRPMLLVRRKTYKKISPYPETTSNNRGSPYEAAVKRACKENSVRISSSGGRPMLLVRRKTYKKISPYSETTSNNRGSPYEAAVKRACKENSVQFSPGFLYLTGE
ncbi:hypothetical protein AALB64_05160, partial [Lachnospiraceae bacterium 45-P1]